MEAGRLDDVEALCIRNSGGCITQSRSRVARFMISAVYVVCLCSRSLIRMHGKKIRVTSKICFRQRGQLRMVNELASDLTSLHTNQQQNNSHTHTTLIMMYLHYYPWINHQCLPLYCLLVSLE